MGERKKPRVKMVAPVRIWGMDSAGKPFNVLGYTLNVSSTGARLGGVKVPLGVGDAITIQYKQKRALFKVVWLGRPGAQTHEQIGVTLLEQDRQIWAEISEPRVYRDDFNGLRSGRSPTPPAPPPAVAQPRTEPEVSAEEKAEETVPAETAPAKPDDATAALVAGEAITDSKAMMSACAPILLRIEQAVKRDPPDPEALREFRDALSKIRQTVWALQQWHEVKNEGSKAFPLLSYLNTERLRFVTQATYDLADDIEHKGVEIDAVLLQTFYEEVDRLRSGSKSARGPNAEVVSQDAEESNLSEDIPPLVASIRAAMVNARSTGMSGGATMDFFSHELQNILAADGVAIAELEKGEMVCAGSSGNAPEAGMVLETETGIGAEAMRSREPVYCQDTQADARVDAELCRSANIGAVAMVPVLASGGDPIGMIEVIAARANSFGNQHVAGLRAAAELLRDLLLGRGPAGRD